MTQTKVQQKKDLLLPFDTEETIKSLPVLRNNFLIYNFCLIKLGFVIHDTNRIFLSPDLWPTNRYESMDLFRESMFLRISYTNPASLINLLVLDVNPNRCLLSDSRSSNPLPCRLLVLLSRILNFLLSHFWNFNFKIKNLNPN